MKSTPRRTRRSNRGFSMTELLIIMLIIGILAALAGLSMRKYRKSVEADATISQLAQLVRTTRELAQTERVTYRMVLRKGTATATAGDAYAVERWVYDSTTGLSSLQRTENYTLPPGWSFGRTPTDGLPTAQLPRGMDEVPYAASGGVCNIIFKGDGAVGNGNDPLLLNPTSNVRLPFLNGNIFIHDTNADPGTIKYRPRAVNVLGTTGRTSVWRLAGSVWRQ